MIHYAGFWNPNRTRAIAQLWDLIETSSFCEDIKGIKDVKDNDDDYNNKEDNNNNDTYDKDEHLEMSVCLCVCVNVINTKVRHLIFW